MTKEDWYPFIILCCAFLVGIAAGAIITQHQEHAYFKTTMHNSAHTGDEIMVDGIAYHVIVKPESLELQALRSSYARRCQAVMSDYFEGMGNGK